MVVRTTHLPAEGQILRAQESRVSLYRALLAIAMIVGLTLLLGLYVYQASLSYQVQYRIAAENQAYAREQRLLILSLTDYAAAQSMDAMVQRARAAGYGPPRPGQIRYVRLQKPGEPRVAESPSLISTAQP